MVSQLIVDLRDRVPRYRLFTAAFKAVTPQEYLADYPDDIEEHSVLVDELLASVTSYEMMSNESVIEIYPRLAYWLN